MFTNHYRVSIVWQSFLTCKLDVYFEEQKQCHCRAADMKLDSILTPMAFAHHTSPGFQLGAQQTQTPKLYLAHGGHVKNV